MSVVHRMARRGSARAALVITLGVASAATAGCAGTAATGAASSLAAAPPAATGAPAATIAPPTLGVPWGGGGQQGYGQVRPATVFNGGDPTGLVQRITWTSWGGTTATGSGIAYYNAPNQAVAQATAQRAVIVAFDLGRCGGHPAYQAVEWYFPQHGGTFRSATYINDCTGAYVGTW